MKRCYDSGAAKRKKRERAVNGSGSLSKEIAWCIYRLPVM